jgi:nucleotide-binding universal stress UspA family protein
MYRRILVPVDGSACSDHAVAHAGALARAFGSEVILLQVRDAASVLRDGIVDAAELLEQRRQEGERALDSAASILAGWPAERRMVDGDPAAEIARAAAELDLVVMGCHGRGILGRLVFGSLAEAVLHRTTCPLLVVPCSRPGEAA